MRTTQVLLPSHASYTVSRKRVHSRLSYHSHGFELQSMGLPLVKESKAHHWSSHSSTFASPIHHRATRDPGLRPRPNKPSVHFDPQFRSRVRAITETSLNPTDVKSAAQLARTPTRQPLTNGTRTRNQTARRQNTLPDTSRDTSNHSRLLFFFGITTVARACRRRSPP